MAIHPAQRHKLLINGVEKPFLKLHFIKNHPNPDPDVFELRLCPEDASGIDYWNTVEIQKFDKTEFYGFVEEITPEVGEDGLEYFITGRCWKVILWKKSTERYQESREIGPEDSEGNVETGFFGSVYPDELIKFILRCPMSVHPKNKIRHKIGWGIPSDFWVCCANETAETFYPDWVALRYTGLSWRGRGATENLNYIDLICDGFDSTYTSFNESGSSPYLHINNDTDQIWLEAAHPYPQVPPHQEGWFTYDDLPVGAVGIYNAMLYVKASVNGFKIAVYIHDGITEYKIGYLNDSVGYDYTIFNLNVVLDTVTKINNAKIYFLHDTGAYGKVHIIYSYIHVEYSTTSDDTILQQINDWFIVNLGENYDDVTAILIECRNNPSMYARNYKIQYATISACCAEAENEDYWNDFDPPVNVTDNTARDILHSWIPQDDVHCIRIMLTASANQAWEISQIYVWQSDPKNYRLLNEGD